ncbi:MAG: heme exporter protein D [Cyclobacteriaceae bacterium]|jgi:heme exporter protein D
MSFNSFAEFLQMGEHGVFVWSCYGITLVVLLVNILRPLQLKSAILRARRQALVQENAREKTREIKQTHGQAHDPVASKRQETP